MASLASHGRGGAGNMADAAKSPKINPTDLETPTLKHPIVTTGRGGTGNMAKNNDPYETRLRQDVEAVPRRSSHGAQHAGRGGAGNVFKASEDDEERALNNENAIVDEPAAATATTGKQSQSNANRGKNWLFGKKAA